MSRIIKCKSKVSLKYDTDIWGHLVRKKPKITKSTRFFNTLGTSTVHIGSEIFSRITFRLHIRRFKVRNNFYKSIRNRARFRIFLGNINNRSLKNFSRLCWFRLPNKYRTETMFETRIDFILYRLNFIRSIKEAKNIIDSKLIYINNNVIKDKRDRLPFYTVLNFGNDFVSRLWFYKRLFITLLLKKRRVPKRIPFYFEFNWRLMEMILISTVELGKTNFPYNIDLIRAVNYYKTKKR